MSADSLLLNPCSLPHLPHVHSSLSPNYQPLGVIRSSIKPASNPSRRSALFQFSPISPHFSARSPRSPLLPQYSPLRAKSPGSATPFVASPLPFSPIVNEKTVADDNWDDIRLDLDLINLESGPGDRPLWIKAFRCAVVYRHAIWDLNKPAIGASLIFLGILFMTWVRHFGIPQPGFGSALPPDTTPVWHPEIQIDAATFIGTSYGSVDGFLGVPFAKPP